LTHLVDVVLPVSSSSAAVGGWFAWDGETPALAIGGTGVVPLVSMLRHARETGSR
jgi:hypothetical protein